MESSALGQRSRSSSPEIIANELEKHSSLQATPKKTAAATDMSSGKKARGTKRVSEQDSLEFQLWKELQQGDSSVSTVSCNAYLRHQDDWKSVTKHKNPILLGKWHTMSL